MEKSRVTTRVLVQALKRHGLLLGQDAALPNVAGLVAGGPVRGSWWAHPASHDIHHAGTSLQDHRDVVLAKLVSGKDTYVHRRLWPALVAVGAAREGWQLDGLSPMAQRLLDAVTKEGELRTDAIPWTGGARKDSPGEASRTLQRKLLVHAAEVHTESGAHAKQLETWERWADRVGFATNELTPEAGRAKLEHVLAELNEYFAGKGRLPWPR